MNKEAIANKAIDIIALDGYEYLTMSNLSSRLNINKSSLYHYFNKKDDIISYLYTNFSNEIKKFGFKISFNDSSLNILTSCFTHWKKMYTSSLSSYMILIEQRKSIDERAYNIYQSINLMMKAQSSAIIEYILNKNKILNKDSKFLSLLFSSTAFSILTSEHEEQDEDLFLLNFERLLLKL